MLPMPNKTQPSVRNAAATDRRIARSTHALGEALIELIQEREFDSITVQQIIDRAGVGRTTFYAHYRNKDDVLHSAYDRLFTMLEAILDRSRSGAQRRLFPVAEFLDHISRAHALEDALRKSGQLDEFWALFAGYTSRIIERQLARASTKPSSMPQGLIARMLAGALMETIRWWHDHPTAATPAEMDTAFHALAHGVLRSVQ